MQSSCFPKVCSPQVCLLPGPTGSNGPRGFAGPSGATGPTGGTGPNGPPGPPGPPGAPGLQGATGGTGSTGGIGPAGALGFTGPAGAPGLQGATGGTGFPGFPGEQGIQGETGDTGPAGEDIVLDCAPIEDEILPTDVVLLQNFDVLASEFVDEYGDGQWTESGVPPGTIDFNVPNPSQLTMAVGNSSNPGEEFRTSVCISFPEERQYLIIWDLSGGAAVEYGYSIAGSDTIVSSAPNTGQTNVIVPADQEFCLFIQIPSGTTAPTSGSIIFLSLNVYDPNCQQRGITYRQLLSSLPSAEPVGTHAALASPLQISEDDTVPLIFGLTAPPPLFDFGNYNSTNGEYIIPLSGRYVITVNLNYSRPTDTGIATLSIFVDTTEVQSTIYTFPAVAGDNQTLRITAEISLISGQIVIPTITTGTDAELVIGQNSDFSINILRPEV